jgi:hypothetical protein
MIYDIWGKRYLLMENKRIVFCAICCVLLVGCGVIVARASRISDDAKDAPAIMQELMIQF